MKYTRLILTVALFAFAAFHLVSNPFGAIVLLCIGSAALMPLNAETLGMARTATLTPTEILMANIKAFRSRVPTLDLFGGDFAGMNLLYNHPAIAHIETLGSASTYSAGSGGYKNGVQDGRNLVLDVPITIDQWATYPVKMTHVNLITDQKNPYGGVVGNGGYVLGKGVVDAVLAKATFARFSRSSTIANADFDVDGLITINEAMNAVTEATERFLIVNSAVASVLAADQRLSNSQWFGSAQGSSPFRMWRNAWGFSQIIEYPGLSANNATALTGVTATYADDIFTKAAHGLQVGDRIKFSSITGGTGLATATAYYVKTVPSSSTFTISATLGGSTLNITASDVTDATLAKTTNLSAVAFERRAFAVKAGAPPQATSDLANQLGIPLTMVIDALLDTETKTAMGMAKWQEEGTGDLYVCPTVLFGTRAGRELTDTVGTSCDYAGHLVITA